jgi:hypothetical protein
MADLDTSGTQLADSWLEACCADPQDVVMTFEASNRWPDELEAIQRVKATMFCSIKKHLEGSTNEAGSSQEASARCAVSDGHMDVVCGGFAFRLTIFYEGEASLMHAVNPAGALKVWTVSGLNYCLPSTAVCPQPLFALN